MEPVFTLGYAAGTAKSKYKNEGPYIASDTTGVNGPV